MVGRQSHEAVSRVAVVTTIIALAGIACNQSSTPPGQLVTAAAVGGPAPVGYLLPAAADTTLVVTNVPNGSADHAPGQYGQYAYDFGTVGDAPFTVAASRGGTVLAVQSDSKTQCSGANLALDGSPDQGCWTKANYVLIDHRDGTSMLYMHFAPNTITVKPGANVCAGTPLGTDGQTGWATGPHLHMQVEQTPTPSATDSSWWFPQSIDGLVFTDPVVLSQQSDGKPLRNQTYKSMTKPTCDVLGAATGPTGSQGPSSPSGQPAGPASPWIAFISSASDGRDQLNVVRADGSDLHRIVALDPDASGMHTNIGFYHWLPDGQSVNYVLYHGQQVANPTSWDSLVVPISGGQVTNLGDRLLDSYWASTGWLIGSGTTDQVYRARADGSGVEALTLHKLEDPTFSPDRTLVALWTAGASDNEMTLVILDTRTWKSFTVASTDYLPDYFLAWSPDGSSLAWGLSGAPHVLDLKNGVSSLLVGCPEGQNDACDNAGQLLGWSSDGTRIIFNGWEVYSVPSTGGPYSISAAPGSHALGANAVQLTHDNAAGNHKYLADDPGSCPIAYYSSGNDTDTSAIVATDGLSVFKPPVGFISWLAWSADCSQLAYSTYSDSAGKFMVMNADGSNPHSLPLADEGIPQNQYFSSAPTWQPSISQRNASAPVLSLSPTVSVLTTSP